MNSLEIKYRWAEVQSSVGINYYFPNAVSAFMREQYCRPSVYRWVVWKPVRGSSALYMGETDNLVRRIQQYLSPGARQATNLRLKAFFDGALKSNEQVELRTLEIESFRVNNLVISMDSLGDTHIRRMLESFILAELEANAINAPPVILNQVFGQNAARKEKRKKEAVTALRKLGLSEQAALVEKARQLKVNR